MPATLSRQRWQVALADIDGEAVSAAAADIGGVAIACDVGSEADVERLVAVARARLGRIDAIVSNAGFGEFEPMPETTLASWNEVLATNLTATFLLAKAAAADLRARAARLLPSHRRARTCRSPARWPTRQARADWSRSRTRSP